MIRRGAVGLTWGLILLSVAGSVAWCSSASSPTSDSVPLDIQDPFAPDTDPLHRHARRLPDPLEGYNRVMFGFNRFLMTVAVEPVAGGYRRWSPAMLRTSVRNVFANLREPVHMVNALLQGEFSDAHTALGRFVINSVWGVGGLFDPASTELPRVDRNFDQTLARWGVGPGPYLVHPFYGSSTLRGSVDLAGRWAVNPAVYSGNLRLAVGVEMLGVVSEASGRLNQYRALMRYTVDPYAARKRIYELQLRRRLRE